MTKLGTGVLQLTNANYFAGGLPIGAGAVLSSAQQGIGNGAVTVSAGGALWLGTSGLNTFTLAGGTLASSVGNNTLAGNVNITADSTISLLDPVLNNTARNLTITSIVSGAGTADPSAVLTVNGIAVNNSGTLTLSSALNSFGGVGKFITLNGGLLAVATDAALTTAFNGGAAGAAAANALSKNGNGILDIIANNNGANAFTGAITVNAGAIRVSNAGALGSNVATTVTNNVGATVQLNGVSTGELLFHRHRHGDGRTRRYDHDRGQQSQPRHGGSCRDLHRRGDRQHADGQRVVLCRSHAARHLCLERFVPSQRYHQQPCGQDLQHHCHVCGQNE